MGRVLPALVGADVVAGFFSFLLFAGGAPCCGGAIKWRRSWNRSCRICFVVALLQVDFLVVVAGLIRVGRWGWIERCRPSTDPAG